MWILLTSGVRCRYCKACSKQVIVWPLCTKRVNEVPCHKGIGRSGDTQPYIHNLGTRWRWRVSFKPQLIYMLWRRDVTSSLYYPSIIEMVLLNNLQPNWPMVTKQELACHEGPVVRNLVAQSWQSSTRYAQIEICQHVSDWTLSFQEDYMGLAESPTSRCTERKNSHCL